MKTRKEYLDPVISELVVLIPDDFPDWTMINGGEFYDYFKVNRWFERHPQLRASRWGYCVGCFNFTPEIKEQTCQHDPDTFVEGECYHSSCQRTSKETQNNEI